MAVRSPMAAQMVADLLDLSPEVRNGWLSDIARDPREYVRVLGHVEEVTGSLYGLWTDDPVGFIEIALGQNLWEAQRHIARLVGEHDRVAIPSGHNLGKTHLSALLVAWMACVWPPGVAKVITTATPHRRVKNQIWPHIRAIHKRASLPGECLITEWKMGDPTQVVVEGFSPDQNDEAAFSGIHAPRILVVVDEAGAMGSTLGRSLESLLSSAGAKVLAIGNPPFDEEGTEWFEQRTMLPAWKTYKLPASKSPAITGEPTPLCSAHPSLPPHPIADHLVTQDWIDTQLQEMTEDDPYYIARVLAEFPKDRAGKVIPRSWLEDCIDNPACDQSTWVRLGVDLASDGGDEFVTARAEGFVIVALDASSGSANANPLVVCGKVLDQILIAEQRARELGSTRKVRVKVDVVGLGWGPVGTLKAWGKEGRHNSEIVGVNVGRKPVGRAAQEKFSKQRHQMWFMGTDLSQPREGEEGPQWSLSSAVADDKLITQLAGPRKQWDSSGRREVETKKEMKARGVPSPDRAEAVLLAMFEPGGAGTATIQRPSGHVPRI